MSSAVRVKTTILPGGRIEITDPHFLPGESVEVIVIAPHLPSVKARSVVDILDEAEGHRLFKTAEEVDAYLLKERESWD